VAKITFLIDYAVDAEGGETYAAGDVVDLPEASAEHFVKRGVAEAIEPKRRGRPKKPPAAEPTPTPAAEPAPTPPDALTAADTEP